MYATVSSIKVTTFSRSHTPRVKETTCVKRNQWPVCFHIEHRCNVKIKQTKNSLKYRNAFNDGHKRDREKLAFKNSNWNNSWLTLPSTAAGVPAFVADQQRLWTRSKVGPVVVARYLYCFPSNKKTIWKTHSLIQTF